MKKILDDQNRSATTAMRRGDALIGVLDVGLGATGLVSARRRTKRGHSILG